MIKQIFLNDVFYRLMDDDETNDVDEVQRIQDEFPDAVIAIVESLDGSNQHEPTELTIVTLDSIESKNIIDPIPNLEEPPGVK